MSAARVRLRPNTTAATRSVEEEMVISWSLRFDANRWVATIAADGRGAQFPAYRPAHSVLLSPAAVRAQGYSRRLRAAAKRR